MINLLPPDVKQSRLFGRRNIKMLTYAVSILVVGFISVTIVLINLAIITNDQHKITDEINSHNKTLQDLQNGQKNIDALADQMKTLDKIYSGEVRFSDLIPKIGAVIPSGMVINGLSLNGGKTNPLQLDVEMDTQELAAVFQQNLVASDLFEAADINTITNKGASATPGIKSYKYGASLVASFKGTAAAKKAAAAPAPTTGAKQ